MLFGGYGSQIYISGYNSGGELISSSALTWGAAPSHRTSNPTAFAADAGLLLSMEKRGHGKKGSSLPLTLINAVLYFSYLLFNFSVVFFKLRNSSVIKVFVSYCLSWVKGNIMTPFYIPICFFALLTQGWRPEHVN